MPDPASLDSAISHRTKRSNPSGGGESRGAKRLLVWLPRSLLLVGVAVTAFGLARLYGRPNGLGLPWYADDVRKLLYFCVAAAVVSGLTFGLLRRQARLVALALLAAFVLVGAGIGPVAATVYLVVCAVALGDLVVSRCAGFASEPLLAFAVSAVLGLGLVAAAVSILAHFPVNRSWLYIPLLALPLLANAKRVVWYLGKLRMWLGESCRDDAATFWSGALLLLVLAIHLVRVVQPETGWDGLVYHFLVASSVAFRGRWSFDFHQYVFAMWPMAADWLSAVGWVLGGEIAARLINFTPLLLVLAMLHAVTVRLSSRCIGRLVATLFASASLTFGLTATTFSEMTMAAFALAAFVVIAATAGDFSRARLAACGVLLGACLLSKASAVFIVLPLAVVLVVICLRQRGLRKGFVAASGAVAICLAVGASAYVYAYVKTGNPVFPFYNAVFKSPYYPAVNFRDDRWVGHLSWLLPYRMTFFSSGYTEGYDGALGFQYLLLFPAGLAAAVAARRRTLLFAAAVSLTAALLVAVSTQYIRYLFPALAIGMLVCAGVFVRIPGQTKTDRRLVGVLAVALIGLNLLFLPAGAFNWNGFRLDGVVSPTARRDLVAAYAPQRMLNEVVNAEAGASARVAYLGFPAGAGLDGTATYASWYDPEFYAAVYGASTSREVLDAFAGRGIGYVITDGYAPPAPVVSDALQEHGTEIAAVNGAVLYRLDAIAP